MRADGSSLHVVDLPHGPALYPSVSPDGTKLLYATFMTPVVDGGVDSTLYLYDFATGTSSVVVTTTELSYSALSPDGKTVAYTTGYDLHDVSTDGTNDVTLLTGPNCGTGYGHPTFGPDSRTIVYVTGGVVGAIGVDGSGNELLMSADPGALYYPNVGFSPDYTQLVMGGFCAPTSPDVLVVFPYASLPGASCQSGRVLTEVSFGAGYSMANDPSWGTNGLIAYGSGQDVYFIPASGGEPVDMTSALTGDSGIISAADPVWAPGCVAIP
jgi:Tol biopolymer transport system component